MSFSPAAISIAFGLLLVILYAWMWRCPRQADAALRAFPRSVLPARILVSVCLVWFALNLWGVDLGRFNGFKVALFLAAPAGYVRSSCWRRRPFSTRSAGGTSPRLPRWRCWCTC